MLPTFTTLRAGLCLFLLSFLTPLVAADYFWIGGSGNWSDISHWATTSGGTTTHSQAPGADDDVFFDANSFTGPGQTVTLNTDIIFCRDMRWAGVTGNPTLIGPASVVINVFGSWELSPAMTYEFSGWTIFSGAGDNTVDYANYSAGNALTFSGSGSWTLANAVSCDSTLAFNEGTLDTDGQDVICGFFRSEGQAQRTLRLGASEIIVTRSSIVPFPQAQDELQYHSMRVEATNLTVEPGTSTIDLRGNRVDILLEGPGTLAFNRVLLSAPMGRSRVIPWTRENGFDSAPTVSYAELDLRHRTLLGGSPVIDHLILAAGQRYAFASGEVFTLNDLTAVGDCTASIDLTAEFPASPTIFRSAAALTADFVSLRSITAEGGGSFTAADAVDLGGNTGWTITEKATEDFFWIGGTGNWNDPAHWSATSGGPTNGCVPSVTDNVFFDANSFTGPGQTVTINVENAACRNMTWMGATGNPNFSGPEDHRMRIAGSLTFVQAMNHDFAGDYVFSARDAGHVITSARQRFNRNVTFDGSGEWSLGDSLYVFEAIDLEAGTLRTADQPVNANFLRSRNAQPRGLFLGNSYVNLASRDMTFFYTEMVLNSENLTFDAGTSVIEFTGGFSGNTFLSGDISLTFNVVIFSSPLGQWSHNLFADGMGLAVTVDSLTYRNSGFIGGENLINYLELRAGRTYEFLRNSTQTVAELVADGSCDEGHTTLQSTTAEEPSFLELPGASGYNRLLLRNMHVTDGAPLPAANSIDGGGNLGWDISGDASRQLFWVGGEGDWFDRSHWSLTSGGPGGECLPTAIDDVFFDENSAVGMPMRIQNFSDRSATCRDITWTAGMTTETFFQVGTVRIHGDLNNAGNLFYNSSPTYFNGVEDDHEIISGGANLNQMVFTQTGTYTIADDLTAGEINYQSGNLIFANERSELFRMVAVRGQGTKNLDLGNTHLILNAGTFGFSEALSLYTGSNLAVTPGTSLIEFTHPTARLRADVLVTLNNLLFSNPTANAEIRSDNPAADALTANSVTFNGSGRLSLELTTDTLVCSPGKSYVFASEKTQRINEYWQIIGNNCTPISLTASTPGLAATASVPASGEILADFIQMRDITGVGGANFLAGSRSTNIDNSNANWVFETAPEFQEVGFLGQDRALCAGEDLTLDAYNFSPGETYRWQDNSTDSTFVTNQSGTYFVEVTFQTSCVIRDTVEILDAQTFTVDLPDDPVICFGDTLTFDVDAGINSADYRWQDGSEESSLQAFTSGEYFVEVDLGGCTETDTTVLTVTPLPTVDLGEDRIACVGDDFTLTATVMAESFRWQDGSTDLDFTDDQAGIYWVEAQNGNCPVRDSIEVTYVDPGTVDLGPDTTVCVANQLVLDANVTGGFTYTWQDGSAGQTFTAVTTGQYFVEINLSGCTAADTIQVTFPDLPELDVVPGYEACLGETLEITATVPADAYRWSNQQTGPDFSTMAPGDYLVTAVFGPCEVTQDFTVDFLAPPVVDLGADITECSGVPVTLTIPLSGTWQDGTQGASYLVTEPGRYRVEAFNGPCPAADSVEVSYLPLPEFSLGEDQTGCAGDPLTVSVPTNLGLIFWDDGADATERSFTEAGVRWVEIEDDNGCVGRDSVEFFYNEFPSIGLGPDTTACDDRPFVLTASASGGNLLWPDGSTAPTFAPDPAGGRTTVVAQLTENGCTSLDTVVVDFRECLDFQAYVPTAFSPNFDGVNDDFGLLTDARIEILEYRISVWSRWGAELFSSADPNELWDGTADGRNLPTGVYLYAIELTIRDDRGVRSQSISGDVTLVR